MQASYRRLAMKMHDRYIAAMRNDLARRYGPQLQKFTPEEIEAKLARARAADPDPGRCCEYCERPAAEDWHRLKLYCSAECARLGTEENRIFAWRRQDLNRPAQQARVDKHIAHQRRYRADAQLERMLTKAKIT